MKHLYRVYDTDTVAADTLTQAQEIWCQMTSELLEDYPHSFEIIPDHIKFDIRYEFNMLFDYEVFIPRDAEFEYSNDLDYGPICLVKATASQWAKASPKPNIICSTEW